MLFLKYLIIKLSDIRDGKIDPIPFGNENKLRERVSGSWRISLKTLYEANHALALYKGQVIAEYSLRSSVQIDRKNRRIRLNLDPVKNSKYIGKILDYPTANPVSVLDEANFKYKKN